MLRGFREAGWDTTMVLKKSWWELFRASESSRWIDACIPWASYDSTEKYKLGKYFTQASTTFFQNLCAACSGSIGIDPRGDIRAVLLLRAAGCRQVMTLSHYLGSTLRVPAGAGFIVPADQELRRWEQNIAFATALGVQAGGMPALRRFGTWQPSDGCPRLGLVPTVTWAGKEWPSGHWRGLSNSLRKGGCSVVGLCGPGQSGDAHRQLGDGVEIIECRNLDSWAARLLSLSCVVACDTGPMHLANTLGVPTVALYGVGKLPLWAPSGRAARILEHQGYAGYSPCQPTEASIDFARELMARITVEEVLGAVKSLQH